MSKKKKKHILYVAFSRKAAEIAEEEGFEKLFEKSKKLKLVEGHDYDIIEFISNGELEAYCQGLTDANGWDSPFWDEK